MRPRGALNNCNTHTKTKSDSETHAFFLHVLGLLKTKSASETRAFFLHQVLSVFGTPAVVVTDQGNDWEAGFRDLLTDAFIAMNQ